MTQLSLIEVNPNKMRGTPVFRDTRVPIKNRFDCIEEGETIDQFLDQFPTVSREQVNGILENSPGKGCSKEKLLLDECVTRHLKRDLAGHEVHTVEEAGFKGLENGDLLKAASGVYEVLITVDQNLPASGFLPGPSRLLHPDFAAPRRYQRRARSRPEAQRLRPESAHPLFHRLWSS